jgi:hypothetical protein
MLPRDEELLERLGRSQEPPWLPLVEAAQAVRAATGPAPARA